MKTNLALVAVLFLLLLVPIAYNKRLLVCNRGLGTGFSAEIIEFGECLKVGQTVAQASENGALLSTRFLLIGFS